MLSASCPGRSSLGPETHVVIQRRLIASLSWFSCSCPGLTFVQRCPGLNQRSPGSTRCPGLKHKFSRFQLTSNQTKELSEGHPVNKKILYSNLKIHIASVTGELPEDSFTSLSPLNFFVGTSPFITFEPKHRPCFVLIKYQISR